MEDPTRVLVAGDWHGATQWACGVIDQLPDLLPAETRRVVVHLGDFGIWPTGYRYIDDVNAALVDADAELGKTWWREEEITEGDTRRAVQGGSADVMVCHDAPASVPLRLPPPSRGWAVKDLARADRHRERLQAIVDEVRPSHLLHGHYHLEHDTTVEMAHGPVQVTGLDCDGAWRGNYRVLNVKSMEWETN